MRRPIKTHIIKIGHGWGVRIPKMLLDQSGLREAAEVELVAYQDQIVIRSVQHPRAGWAEQFQAMAAAADDTLLDDPAVDLTTWDAAEWVW
jgi:antitoxin MazE